MFRKIAIGFWLAALCGSASAQTLPSPAFNTATAVAFVPSNPALHGDAQFNKTATVTTVNGNATVTITGSTFTSADVGKLITISGVMSGGAYLSTTITAVSGSSVTLATPPNANFGPATAAVVWGTDDAATVQSMLNQVSNAKGGMTRVQFGPGKYLVSVVSLIKSNTEIACDPGADFYMLKAQSGAQTNHWIFANQNFTATSLTDANISIHGCKFYGATGTQQASSGAHAIRMSYVTRLNVYNNRFESFGDAVANTSTNIVWVHDNAAYDIINTCWDQWAGWSHHKISNNYCETWAHGTQATGTDSSQTNPLISSDLTEIGDTVLLLRPSDASQTGTWLNSGMTSGAGSGVQHVTIIGNNVSTIGANYQICVKVSGDQTKDVQVIGTRCNNAILYAGPVDVQTAYPTDIHFSSNHVSFPSPTAATAAISLACQFCTANNNRVDGGGYQYAIKMDFKPNMSATDNSVVAGTDATSPRIFVGATASATSVVIDTNDATSATTFNVLNTPIAIFSPVSSPSAVSVNGAAHNVQVLGTGTASRSFDVVGYNTAGAGANINCAISRATAPGSFAAVVANDECDINVVGDDGSSLSNTNKFVKIGFRVIGPVSTGVVPGAIDFYTANASGVLGKPLTLTSTGQMQIGSTGFTSNGSVATAMSALGPAGSHATIQKWLTVQDSGGTVFYIPAF